MEQIYLGDERFFERMQALAEPQRAAAREMPKPQGTRMGSGPRMGSGLAFCLESV